MVVKLVISLIVIAAQLYGPTLLAGALPEGLRPADHTKPGRMTPATIMDALEEIRGTLE